MKEIHKVERENQNWWGGLQPGCKMLGTLLMDVNSHSRSWAIKLSNNPLAYFCNITVKVSSSTQFSSSVFTSSGKEKIKQWGNRIIAMSAKMPYLMVKPKKESDLKEVLWMLGITDSKTHLWLFPHEDFSIWCFH